MEWGGCCGVGRLLWSGEVVVERGGCKLQALIYDILPSRKVPESDARSVGWLLWSGYAAVEWAGCR